VAFFLIVHLILGGRDSLEPFPLCSYIVRYLSRTSFSFLFSFDVPFCVLTTPSS
jgi:hypothetical protein